MGIRRTRESVDISDLALEAHCEGIVSGGRESRRQMRVTNWLHSNCMVFVLPLQCATVILHVGILYHGRAPG